MRVQYSGSNATAEVLNGWSTVTGTNGSYYNKQNQNKGFAISIVVHVLAIFIIFQVSTNITPATDLLVVDFNIMEPIEAPRQNHQKIKQAPVPAPTVTKAPPKPFEETTPEPVVRKKLAPKLPKISEPRKPRVASLKYTPTPPPKPVKRTVVATLPAPAAGSPSAANTTSKYIKAQFNYIQENIQQNIVYPRMAQKMGWEGKVVVEFIICADGMVKSVQIIESSGFKALDKNAISTIKSAAPFPAPKVAAKLIIPVVYRLS